VDEDLIDEPRNEALIDDVRAVHEHEHEHVAARGRARANGPTIEMSNFSRLLASSAP
jgi:hypothetical protein